MIENQTYEKVSVAGWLKHLINNHLSVISGVSMQIPEMVCLICQITWFSPLRLQVRMQLVSTWWTQNDVC